MAKLRDDRFLFPGGFSSDNITCLDIIMVKQLSNGACHSLLFKLIMAILRNESSEALRRRYGSCYRAGAFLCLLFSCYLTFLLYLSSVNMLCFWAISSIVSICLFLTCQHQFSSSCCLTSKMVRSWISRRYVLSKTFFWLFLVYIAVFICQWLSYIFASWTWHLHPCWYLIFLSGPQIHISTRIFIPSNVLPPFL